MTGEEHHREAENLLNHWWGNRNDIGRAQQFMPWLAAAQVHATLALAAATAGGASRRGGPGPGGTHLGSPRKPPGWVPGLES